MLTRVLVFKLDHEPATLVVWLRRNWTLIAVLASIAVELGLVYAFFVATRQP